MALCFTTSRSPVSKLQEGNSYYGMSYDCYSAKTPNALNQ